MLLLDLISVLFAVFGVYAFTSQYTCWLTRVNNGLNKACKRFMWIPSACVVVLVLGMAVFRSNF